MSLKATIFAILIAGAGCASAMAQDDNVLSQRQEAERLAVSNPFIINQHRMNYFLPVSYYHEPNYDANPDLFDGLIKREEAAFQVSIKAPVLMRGEESVEGLYAAFTAKSFWQLYNADISRPFRETNYEPEVFYQWLPNYTVGSARVVGVTLGFSHQSNGQIARFSRSWNRIVANVAMDMGDYYTLLKVWHRIEEDAKSDELDPSGDDNPDILDYLGHFELTIGTEQFEGLELSLMMRNNLDFDDNRGFYEFRAAYPLTDHFDLLFLASTGYGDSLIDYNVDITRYSLGFKLATF